MKDNIQLVQEYETSSKFIYSGMVLETCGKIGQYASALFGISAIIGNQPDIKGAFYAGIGFAAASILSIAGNSMRQTFALKANDLEKEMEKREQSIP